MPREVIAKSVERDWSRDCQEDPCANPLHVLEVRTESLNVEWGRGALATLPVDEAVQITIKQVVEGEVQRRDNGEPDPFCKRVDLGSTERYSLALTRKQINHLIKTLRRARDQVFGVDE